MPTFLEREPTRTCTADDPEGATGGAPMLNEPSDLGAAGLVADRFAAADEARMAELDRLIKAGEGSVAPQPQHKEDPMPCSRCSSKDHNVRTCPELKKATGQSAGEKPAKVVAPAPTKQPRAAARPLPRKATTGAFNLEVATVEDLVATIAACQDELGRRETALEEALALVKKARAA